MRKEFEMTEAQFAAILDASKPVPYMVFGGMPPPTPQENANVAWRSLGRELGFKWDTCEPIPGKSDRWFSAEALDALKGGGL